MREVKSGIRTIAKLYWPRGFGGYVGKDTVVTGATADDGGNRFMIQVETLD
jgi:hypothetical protein